jgi:hypothetical protein
VGRKSTCSSWTASRSRPSKRSSDGTWRCSIRATAAAGATIVPEERLAPYRRFFFREPVNGYFLEVIDEKRAPKP